MGAMTIQLPTPEHDPYRWLEDVEGERQLAWARERNGQALAALGTERFRQIEGRHARRPGFRRTDPRRVERGAFLYNFWRDGDHERGLWRRTTWESYRTDQPEWDVLIDLDALAAAEGVNWVWAGARVLYPSNVRAIISLSRGGADATTDREFDLTTRTFVDAGFARAEAKGAMTWADSTGDEVFVYTDFGDGSMTPSGYPRIVKRWRRGTPPGDATTVYEGEPTDMYIGAHVDATPGFERAFIGRNMTFYTMQLIQITETGLAPVPVPDSAEAEPWREWLLVELREDWTVGARTFRAGSLLVGHFDAVMAGGANYQVLFEPTATVSLANVTTTRHHVVLTLLDDVTNRVQVVTPTPTGGWRLTDANLTQGGIGRYDTVGIRAVDPTRTTDSGSRPLAS